MIGARLIRIKIRGENHMNKARVYEETIIIPTYRIGSMEKDPLFIEKRAYQGSTGKVYPVPICEKISDVNIRCFPQSVISL